MHDVSEHKWCEQCTHDLLLQIGVWMKVLASSTQDEDVEDTEESADMRKL
jgi:hypothetical protein